MVQVEVDRWVSEGMLVEASTSLRCLRRVAAEFQGFMRGRLLQRRDDPHHWTAISEWKSIEDWRAWESSEERRRINGRLAPLLHEPESVIVLEPLTGG